MSAQPIFGFPPPERGFDDLVVSASNEAALRVVRQPSNWPMPVLCLVGPPKSGLTTIAGAWARMNDAARFTTRAFDALPAKTVDAMERGFVVIEDAARVKKSEKLLSLINRMTASSGRLLLTANTPPAQWTTSSADLQSRLKSMPVAEIDPPDEDGLVRRLKASAERYFLKLEPDVLHFLSLRLDLTYADIENCVQLLSEAVSENDRAPSIPLARSVLDRMGGHERRQARLL